jgi:hypothetical protein
MASAGGCLSFTSRIADHRAESRGQHASWRSVRAAAGACELHELRPLLTSAWSRRQLTRDGAPSWLQPAHASSTSFFRRRPVRGEQRSGSSSRGRERLEKIVSLDSSLRPTLVACIIVRGAYRARVMSPPTKGGGGHHVENEEEEVGGVGGW